MQPLQSDKRYTYADYAGWDDENRYELIDGVIHMMSPAPTRMHQEILLEMARQFGNFLIDKPCKAFIAPFDVRLSAAGNNDDTVVQPDIVVVCDKSKLDDKGCNGVPDMIVEILSPSTANRDKVLKFNKYLRAGVREYWIVDPDLKNVHVHILDNDRYYTAVYAGGSTIPVHTLEGCRIDMKDAFA